MAGGIFRGGAGTEVP
jgi:hypothetical protein